MSDQADQQQDPPRASGVIGAFQDQMTDALMGPGYSAKLREEAAKAQAAADAAAAKIEAAAARHMRRSDYQARLKLVELTAVTVGIVLAVAIGLWLLLGLGLIVWEARL